jgi:hypothetical protein
MRQYGDMWTDISVKTSVVVVVCSTLIFQGDNMAQGKGVGAGEFRELELPSGWSL